MSGATRDIKTYGQAVDTLKQMGMPDKWLDSCAEAGRSVTHFHLPTSHKVMPFDMRSALQPSELDAADPISRAEARIQRGEPAPVREKGSGNELSPDYRGASVPISPDDPRLTVVRGKVQTLAVIPVKQNGELDMKGVVFHPDQSVIKQRNVYDLDNVPYDPVTACRSRGAGYGGAIPMSEPFSYSKSGNRKGVTKRQEVTGHDAEVLAFRASEAGLPYTRTYMNGKYQERTVIVPIGGDMTPNPDGSGHKITGLTASELHESGITQSQLSRHFAAGKEAELTKNMMLRLADKGEIDLQGPTPTAAETQAFADKRETEIRQVQVQAGCVSKALQEYGPNIVLMDGKCYQNGDIHFESASDGQKCHLTAVPDVVNQRLAAISTLYSDADGSQYLAQIDGFRSKDEPSSIVEQVRRHDTRALKTAHKLNPDIDDGYGGKRAVSEIAGQAFVDAQTSDETHAKMDAAIRVFDETIADEMHRCFEAGEKYDSKSISRDYKPEFIVEQEKAVVRAVKSSRFNAGIENYSHGDAAIGCEASFSDGEVPF